MTPDQIKVMYAREDWVVAFTLLSRFALAAMCVWGVLVVRNELRRICDAMRDGINAAWVAYSKYNDERERAAARKE